MRWVQSPMREPRRAPDIRNTSPPDDRASKTDGASEFFAVATETFFLQPQALADQHPALYGQLSRFYALDPRAW